MIQRNLDIVMYSMKMDKDLFFRLVKEKGFDCLNEKT